MNNQITRDLKRLNEDLTLLRKEGVTLNKKENQQLAKDVRKDAPGKGKPFWKKVLGTVTEVAPLVLPIIKMLL
jgi:hypothetical protein